MSVSGIHGRSQLLLSPDEEQERIVVVFLLIKVCKEVVQAKTVVVCVEQVLLLVAEEGCLCKKGRNGRKEGTKEEDKSLNLKSGVLQICLTIKPNHRRLI